MGMGMGMGLSMGMCMGVCIAALNLMSNCTLVSSAGHGRSDDLTTDDVAMLVLSQRLSAPT